MAAMKLAISSRIAQDGRGCQCAMATLHLHLMIILHVQGTIPKTIAKNVSQGRIPTTNIRGNPLGIAQDHVIVIISLTETPLNAFSFKRMD